MITNAFEFCAALVGATLLREYLEIAEVAGAAVSRLRPDPETGGGRA